MLGSIQYKREENKNKKLNLGQAKSTILGLIFLPLNVTWMNNQSWQYFGLFLSKFSHPVILEDFQAHAWVIKNLIVYFSPFLSRLIVGGDQKSFFIPYKSAQ